LSEAAAPARRKPNLVLALVRVIVMTVAFGVLGMGVGGLLGIIAVAVINMAGVATDMSMALFAGAMPGAVIGALMGFAVIVRSERQAIKQNPPRIAADRTEIRGE
jgi:hypothetical protein